MTDLLFAVLIALIPALIAVISARVYNFVHGLFMFCFTGYILIFCLGIFGPNLPAEIMAHIPTTCGLYFSLNALVVDLLKTVGLAGLLPEEYLAYAIIGIYVVLFIAFQIISSAIRKARKEKIESLKRQIKRY